MFDFFSKILDYIKLAWDFVLNLINQLVNAFNTLLNALQTTAEISFLMPSIFITSFTLVVGICVINYIIGRNG